MQEELSFSRILFLIALAVAIVLPVRLWVIEPIYIASPSMEPTLLTGTHVFMDKMTLRFRAPRRGDIVVFVPPVGKADHELVKRVIAVAGEAVELRAKKVHVNGQPLFEPYVEHKREGERLMGDDLGPVTVPAGAVFVLGDNRDESKDSSVWRDDSGEPVYFLKLKNVRGMVRGFY